MYLPDVCDTRATDGDRTIAATEVVDTSVDSFCNGGIITQPGGPELCVVRYDTLTIAGDWRVTGARVLALVTDGNLTISGLLDASSSGSLTGPGSSSMGSNGQGTNRGGGAGLATRGGDQGNAAGTGGLSYDPLALPYLGAGMHGGVRASQATCQSGGAGGGGVTLVSCRGTIAIEGIIYAGGHGGLGGGTFGTNDRCIGAGGGAGGIVLFQGIDVRISGQVFANGGAGGCGLDGVTPGAVGPDAKNARATGAVCPSANGAGGGAGGTAVNPPGNGAVGTGIAAVGGGGGSVGVLQVMTPADVVPSVTPLSVSPDFQERKSIPTR